MSTLSSRVGWGTERSLASTSFDGTYQNIGTPLDFSPTVIIFDNQTDVEVPISVDGSNVWKTFSAGEALILDVRTNQGVSKEYAIDKGTQFMTNASVGTSGIMSVSFIYAR